MVFLKNIKLINEFYNSDFYKKNLLGNTVVIKRVIGAILTDPDNKDKTLICKAKEYDKNFKKEMNLSFSPDGICGWKILFDVYSVKGDNSWVSKYKTIRGSKYGEIYFPCQKDQNKNTINMERNNILGDRIDLFLYDFKLKIEDSKLCKLKYENKYSRQFLNYYKNKGFKQYILDFGLEVFIKEDEDKKISITNIATGKALTEVQFEEFIWTNRYGIEIKKKIMKPYLDNLVDICSKNPKPKNNNNKL